MAEQPSTKSWDPMGFAIAGAVCGLIIGGAHETGEVFFSDPSEIESLGQITAEILGAAWGGSFIFAIIAAIHNRLKQEP